MTAGTQLHPMLLAGAMSSPCASAACLMAQMLRQRIYFEGLGADLRERHAEELAKRAQNVRQSPDMSSLQCILCLAVSWLMSPSPALQASGDAVGPHRSDIRQAGQKAVLRTVVDITEILVCLGIPARELVAPIFEILREIMRQAQVVTLEEACGSREWLRIALLLEAPPVIPPLNAGEFHQRATDPEPKAEQPQYVDSSRIVTMARQDEDEKAAQTQPLAQAANGDEPPRKWWRVWAGSILKERSAKVLRKRYWIKDKPKAVILRRPSGLEPRRPGGGKMSADSLGLSGRRKKPRMA